MSPTLTPILGWLVLGALAPQQGGGGAVPPPARSTCALPRAAAPPSSGATGEGGSVPPTTPPQPICHPGMVLSPPGWVAGDTHVHLQRCLSPRLFTLQGHLLQMAYQGLGVSNVLIWGSPFTTVQSYLSSFLPLVTGAEDPATAGDPALYAQFGVELSGFHAAELGHVSGLGIGPAQANLFRGLGCPGDDGSGDYAAPVLDLFHTAPGAVAGYAHVAWPVLLSVDRSAPGASGWNWEDPALPAYVGADARCSFGKNVYFPPPNTFHFQPFLAPFETALHKVDYVETVDMTYDFGRIITTGELEERWFGLYYKLIGAGLRVGVAAGTDTDCYTAQCDPRVWVRTPTGPSGVDYADWLRGLKEGRSTLSAGGYQFLDLEVGGQPIGSTLDVESGSAPLELHATYTLLTDQPVDDGIEILVDGEVVATQPLVQVGSGTYELTASLEPTESTWVVARTSSYGAHTAATYVMVDGEPIVDCATDEYWTLYADYVTWLIDTAKAGGYLQSLIGCSEGEIRALVAAGRRVFAARRDYDAPPPTGIARFGRSTPSAFGPLGIVVDAPLSFGDGLTATVFGAPSRAPGLLLIGEAPLEPPVRTRGGALLYVGGAPDQGSPFVVPVLSDEGGVAQVSLPAVHVAPGETWYAQFVFPGLPYGTAPDCASGALELVAQ